MSSNSPAYSREYEQDLGADASVILSRLAEAVEGQWVPSDQGYDTVRIDDAVRQQVKDLKDCCPYLQWSRFRLVRFRNVTQYSPPAPTYFVPIKVEAGTDARIIPIEAETGTDATNSGKAFVVGKRIWVTKAAMITPSVEAIMFQ